MFAALQHTSSLITEVVELYNNVYIILNSRTDGDSVKAAVDHLKDSITNNNVNEPSILNEFQSFYNEAVTDGNENDQSDERADECKSAATNETNLSLKSLSPFTSAFKSAIATIQVSNDSCEQNSNLYYSCDSFSVTQDVIHLYPLWSGCLQNKELAFAYEAQSTENHAVPSVAVKCRTNSKVESYFKSVKFGSVEAGVMQGTVLSSDLCWNVFRVSLQKQSFQVLNVKRKNVACRAAK